MLPSELGLWACVNNNKEVREKAQSPLAEFMILRGGQCSV